MNTAAPCLSQSGDRGLFAALRPSAKERILMGRPCREVMPMMKQLLLELAIQVIAGLTVALIVNTLTKLECPVGKGLLLDRAVH